MTSKINDILKSKNESPMVETTAAAVKADKTSQAPAAAVAVPVG